MFGYFCRLEPIHKVGDLADPKIEMGQVASSVAVENIKTQLKDAVARDAKNFLGGEIEGNLVCVQLAITVIASMHLSMVRAMKQEKQEKNL